jgi:hypothetical protein
MTDTVQTTTTVPTTTTATTTDAVTTMIAELPSSAPSSTSSTILASEPTPSETAAGLSSSADIMGGTTEVTKTPSSESSFLTDPMLYTEVRHFAKFAKAVPQEVRQQISTQYTSNVNQWWAPFRQLLLDIVEEYRKMLAGHPPSPPEACKQDIYHRRYIATDLTVSVVIYSLNMITDVASFGSIYKLAKSVNKFTDMTMINFNRF